MEWAVVWSWTVVVVQWCFYAAALLWLLKWWLRSMSDSAKLRFVETKVDALLDHFDVEFQSGFRTHIAAVLREQGKRRAIADYVLHTGDDWEDARRYVEDLSRDSKTSQPKRLRSSGGFPTADEVHELLDEALYRSHGKSRRRRTRKQADDQ